MKKTLCAIWELDGDSVSRLEALSLAASGQGSLCASFYPHITLGCYEDIEDRQLRPWLRAYAAKAAPFPLSFAEVGLLTSELAACFPRFQGELRRHYLAFHERFDAYADRWTARSGGLYTPHVTLYQGQDGLDRAAQERLAAVFQPFQGQVRALALSWVRGPEDYQVLAAYPLTGKA
ncbi:MAG: 2'-5' RNA ligase family protein [Christensenellales bacterium]